MLLNEVKSLRHNNTCNIEMPREPKFNFVSAESIRNGKEETKPTVAVSKLGVLRFSKMYLQKYSAIGSFVRFFVDLDKNALGWTLYKTIGSEELRDKGYRLLTANKQGCAQISLSSIFKHLKVSGRNITKIPVEEYKDKMYNTIHYITFNVPTQLYPNKNDVRNNIDTEKVE